MTTTRIAYIERRLEKLKNELFGVADGVVFGPTRELLLDSFTHVHLACEKLKQIDDEQE